MIEEIIESIPNLSEHNKIQIRMKASIFDLKNDEDLSKRRSEFIEFYKTNPNKNKKNDIITLKIGEKIMILNLKMIILMKIIQRNIL